jgi:hypothetical protein
MSVGSRRAGRPRDQLLVGRRARSGRRAKLAQRASLGRVARLGQVALGLLWLIDGLLQFQPYMFGKTFITGVILPNASGQPGIIGSPITWIANLIEPHVALFNAFAATLQVLIGLGLLVRRTVKPALMASFGWAIGIWVTGEGLGMIFTGEANPATGAPGAALLYIVAGVMCWPRAHAADRPGDETSSALGLTGERGARWAWAALWLGSAVLWLLPDAGSSMHDAVDAAPSGAGWLSRLLGSAASAAAGHGTLIAIVASILSATIGVAVLRGWHAKPFLVLAIVISLVYWVVGQGLGGIFTGQATDVSTAPLVIVIAAMLIASKRATERQSIRKLLLPVKRVREAS